jgi:hypothetical protein
MNFSELDTIWKVLVIIGCISLFLLVCSIVLIILIFKTNLISVDDIIESKVDIHEYSDFINNLFEDSLEKDSLESPLQQIQEEPVPEPSEEGPSDEEQDPSDEESVPEPSKEEPGPLEGPSS